MNILHLIGYLGADPEMRYTPGGQKVWALRLATRSRKGGQEETIWWRVSVWGDQFDKMLTYFNKGKPIYVIAEMNPLSTYTDKNGATQISYEATARSLHFVPVGDGKQEGRQDDTSHEPRQQNAQPAGSLSSGYTEGASTYDEEEPIPF